LADTKLYLYGNAIHVTGNKIKNIIIIVDVTTSDLILPKIWVAI
jgi:hypothetical protein